ncbi:hypothetical protein Ancab_019114 [Ancistrocladus abbreviatus]
MESAEICDGNDVREAGGGGFVDGPSHVNVGNVQDSENVDGEILQNLDSYLSLEINDHLTISWMVSDSVVKGIVSAVSQEAVEMVSAKELQVAELKEALRLHQLGYESMHEWQFGHELQKQIELMVIRDAIQSLQGRLWDENVDLCGNETVRCKDKFEGMSSLRQELDAIRKSLSSLEVGHLSSQGSLEMDHTQRKVLSTHVSAPSSLSEGNGKLEESKINMPENFESSQLKHMTPSDLYAHFRTVITKMKRDHESVVQRLTEENFSLKRELFRERDFSKERGSFPPFKKDKDVDILKKTIPDVILKLDHILSGNEILPEICDACRNRLDSVLCENRHLEDLLVCKDSEMKDLSSKVSKDAEQLSQQHSMVEENLFGQVENLKCSAGDAQLEASISEDVYKCILKELVCQFQSDEEEADVKSAIMQEILGIIYDEAAHKAEATMKQESLDLSDIESLIMQGISGMVLQEVLKGLEGKLKDLKIKCLQYDKHSALLESKSLKMEEELRIADEEGKRLKNEIMVLERRIGEKDKTIMEATTALEKEKEQSESANEELTKLMSCTKQQEALIFERNEELEKLKMEIKKLTQKLDQETARCLAVSEEKQNILSLVEANDRENRRLMEWQDHFTLELLKEFDNFECRLAESTEWNILRLDKATFQVSSLIQKAKVIQRTGLLYKQRFEKRCSDLQKAEAEVDVLGDEVETLLDLLEKIYIALDHYAPILEHYPGIMEILKLVKGELSGESTRAMFRTP